MKKSLSSVPTPPRVFSRVPLSRLSNYRIGGLARYVASPKNIKELKAVLLWSKSKKLPLWIWGSGTNILPPDRGFRGVVILPKFEVLRASGTKVEVGAGVLMADLLNFSARRGLSGLEWAGGLPGTVGGAVRGNAGCFGGEMKDVVYKVESLDLETLEIKVRNNKECAFHYRDSIFKRSGQEIVLKVVLKLRSGEAQAIRSHMGERILYRKERHPLEYPNIGSIFKNIPVEHFSASWKKRLASVIKTDPFPVVPTAYLISELRLKGKRRGGAMISPKHPNFIVNLGKARAADVRELMSVIKKKVKKTFGVELEAEVLILK